MKREEVADALIGIQEDLPSEEDRAVLGFAAHYLRHAQRAPKPVAWSYEVFYRGAWTQRYSDVVPAENKLHRNVRPLYLGPSLTSTDGGEGK